jgi:cytidine deaminase
MPPVAVGWSQWPCPTPTAAPCRQLLHEAGGSELVVNEMRMAEWLPGAFGPEDLE